MPKVTQDAVAKDLAGAKAERAKLGKDAELAKKRPAAKKVKRLQRKLRAMKLHAATVERKRKGKAGETKKK